MKTARTEYSLAVGSLKVALKRQGLTYQDLARRIGLSESGVKKIFSARDGSFQRIAQICKELGLTMSEVLAGEEESMRAFSYSLEQQEYMIAHPSALKLYWALVYERQSLEDTLKFMGLSAKTAFPFLRKLDQLKLLELLPGDKVRVPAIQQIRWVGDGPLIRKLYQEWGARFLRSVATPEQRPNEQFIIRYFRASSQTTVELMAALRDLEKEFVRRAIRDMRTEDPSLVHLRWMSAVDNKSYLEEAN